MNCPKCNGHGKIPLTVDLHNTFLIVEKLGTASAAQIQAELDTAGNFHVTAFNNRLEFLFKLGLLKREKKSRQWIYSLAK